MKSDYMKLLYIKHQLFICLKVAQWFHMSLKENVYSTFSSHLTHCSAVIHIKVFRLDDDWIEYFLSISFTPSRVKIDI